MKEFISIDVETTGLSPFANRIVEIGAVRFDSSGKEINRFQSFVNPTVPIPLEASRIHGITDADVASAPLFQDVAQEFFSYLVSGGLSDENPFLIAHNASFDVGFINEEIKRAIMWGSRASYDVFCSLALSRHKNRFLRSHSLPNLVAHYNIEPNGFHRSICDCLYLKDIWIKLSGHEEPASNLKKYRISR